MPGSKANGRIEPSAQAIIEGGHEDAPPQEFFSSPLTMPKAKASATPARVWVILAGQVLNGSDNWHDFYLGLGGAAATLTGLVLVALSLHPTRLLQQPLFRTRALGVLAGMLTVSVASFVLLIPERLLIWSAATEVAFGLGGLVSLIVMSLRVRGEPGFVWLPAAGGIVAFLTATAGGVSLILDKGGDLGFGLLVVGLLGGLLTWSWNAWRLIVYVEPNPIDKKNEHLN